jgi:hypothetical protein
LDGTEIDFDPVEVRQRRDEAMQAGDMGTVVICNLALGDPATIAAVEQHMAEEA